MVVQDLISREATGKWDVWNDAVLAKDLSRGGEGVRGWGCGVLFRFKSEMETFKMTAQIQICYLKLCRRKGCRIGYGSLAVSVNSQISYLYGLKLWNTHESWISYLVLNMLVACLGWSGPYLYLKPQDKSLKMCKSPVPPPLCSLVPPESLLYSSFSNPYMFFPTV